MYKIVITAAAVLLLAGCGSNEPTSAPSPTGSASTAPTPPPASTPKPTAPGTLSVEQAEVNYQQAVCAASLQVYVSVQEQSDRPPSYSRAVRLGLDGCVALTAAQYGQAVIKWASLGD